MGNFTCPRREEIGGFGVFSLQEENADVWQADKCSYCGSLNPDKFLELAKAKAELGPTDKNYKVYVGNDKFYFQHLNKEQMQEFVSLLNQNLLKIGYPEYFYVLPFFIGKSND